MKFTPPSLHSGAQTRWMWLVASLTTVAFWTSCSLFSKEESDGEAEATAEEQETSEDPVKKSALDKDNTHKKTSSNTRGKTDKDNTRKSDKPPGNKAARNKQKDNTPKKTSKDNTHKKTSKDNTHKKASKDNTHKKASKDNTHTSPNNSLKFPRSPSRPNLTGQPGQRLSPKEAQALRETNNLKARETYKKTPNPRDKTPGTYGFPRHLNPEALKKRYERSQNTARTKPDKAPRTTTRTPQKTPKATPSGKRRLEKILTREEIKRTTGYQGMLRPTPLRGIEDSDNYAALRLRPSGLTNFGASVQVWKITHAGQQIQRFNELLRQYPDANRNRKLGDMAFSSTYGNLKFLVWLNRKKHLLVAMSCDDKVCQDAQAVINIARRIEDRLPTIFLP